LVSTGEINEWQVLISNVDKVEELSDAEFRSIDLSLEWEQVKSVELLILQPIIYEG
jgi:hypothetical protein